MDRSLWRNIYGENERRAFFRLIDLKYDPPMHKENRYTLQACFEIPNLIYI